MKKILFILALLSTTTFASINFRVGVDTYSKSNGIGPYTDGSTEGVGFEIGTEYLFEYIPLLKIGAGISYQSLAKISGKDTDWNIGNYRENFKEWDNFYGFQSIPVYLTAKLTPLPFFPFNPYLKVNLGYSFNFGNDNIVYRQGTRVEDDYIPDTGVPPIPSYSYTSNTKVSNGMYYGVGVGAEFLMLGVELMYQSNLAELNVNDKDYGNKKYDVNYDRLSLILNFKF